ncbi:myeloid-derived growth factor-like [Ambystoma mexicanum]|uniref:myeloid-derived growth factor-like n=1 Tax=Ambystoma mexicanum TaxID=8296 RepID=UPI0037E87FFB
MLATSGTCGETPPITKDFDVRPGGQVHSFSRTLGGYTCTFTYAAQGGTNEQWQISLAVSVDGSLFSCSMYRPQGTSYLFFTQFEAKVEGGTIEHAQASSHSDKDVPLKKEEYEVGETTVSHKQGVFGSSLAKIIMIAKTHHAEL